MQCYEKYKDSGVEWIGDIPENWEVKKFKYLYDLITNKNDLGLPKIGLENIESETGKFIASNTDFEGEGIHFKINDILFGKLRPYLAKVYLAEFEGKAIGDFYVFRCKNELTAKYSSKLILSKSFIDLTNSSTFGSKMPRVAWDIIANFEIAYPSLKEQTTIANYLDRKTSEIDQLIAQKEKLLCLYEEEKNAIINQAVTQGINPDVKLKDSGIDWLGEIPEHWEVKKLKYLISKAGSGVTPKGGASVYQLSGIPLLRSQNVHFDGLKLDDVAYITEETHCEMFNSQVFSGDVLLNITGASIGRCYYVTDSLGEANVNQHVCILRSKEIVLTQYLYFILRSNLGQEQINFEQTGSGREGLNFEVLKNFLIPSIDLKEQTAIVHHIENQTTRINAKISKTKKIIALQKEYRTALISEVVTGKIKVTQEMAS